MRLVRPQEDRYWEGWQEGHTAHVLSGTGDKKPRATQKAFETEKAAGRRPPGALPQEAP